MIGVAVGAAGAVATIMGLSCFFFASRKSDDDEDELEVEVDEVSQIREVQLDVNEVLEDY